MILEIVLFDSFLFLVLMPRATNYLSLAYFVDKAMVLKHHPDKRKAAGEPIKEGDNDYFTCITKGNNILESEISNTDDCLLIAEARFPVYTVVIYTMTS